MTTANLATRQPNRQELLYYFWIACTAFSVFGLFIFTIWFMLPSGNFHPSKIFVIDSSEIPPSGSVGLFPNGQFVLAHTDDDALVALDIIVPGLGCFAKWVPTNHRFEDPCVGHRFRLDGTYISGTDQPRTLNRFGMTIVFEDGTIVISNEQGDPIALNGQAITSISVDICKYIQINDEKIRAYFERNSAYQNYCVT
jgi:hypothetical protein